MNNPYEELLVRALITLHIVGDPRDAESDMSILEFQSKREQLIAVLSKVLNDPAMFESTYKHGYEYFFTREEWVQYVDEAAEFHNVNIEKVDSPEFMANLGVIISESRNKRYPNPDNP